jgi:hypothetical protein
VTYSVRGARARPGLEYARAAAIAEPLPLTPGAR